METGELVYFSQHVPSVGACIFEGRLISAGKATATVEISHRWTPDAGSAFRRESYRARTTIRCSRLHTILFDAIPFFALRGGRNADGLCDARTDSQTTESQLFAEPPLTRPSLPWFAR
jgi:hypothetical protein